MTDMSTVQIRGARSRAARGERASRMTRVMQASRRIRAEESRSGRAWINGREVGGADPRWAHLSRSYD